VVLVYMQQCLFCILRTWRIGRADGEMGEEREVAGVDAVVTGVWRMKI